MRTEREPRPRLGDIPPPRRLPRPETGSALPRDIAQPKSLFVDVMQSRRSRVGGAVGIEDLSSLLWHATAFRERAGPGRFGLPWESRPAPSAGGLHPIRILALPIAEPSTAGEYDPDEHWLAAIDPSALAVNRASSREILGEVSGTTLQFAYDVEVIEACYENAETLMWRDAGALAATVCLVATALGLTSVVLGRVGDDVVRAAGLNPGLVGAGAVHIGTPLTGGTE